MADKQWRYGQFTWRELLTNDVAKSRGFYGELFGWSFEEMPMPGAGTYTTVKLGQRGIGGLWKLPEGAPFPPYWGGYISVENADRALKAVTDKGGKLLMPAQDIEGVGRFAPFMDSTGAAVSVLQANEPSAPVPERPEVHDFCWETLNTTDANKAKDFYAAVAGWKVETGPESGMTIFTAGAKQVADLQVAPPGMHSNWLSHVVVRKLEASRDKAAKLGAKVLMPLIDIPKIGRMAVIADPQGAALSLFEPGPME
jgi:predicted enzyme related to lactoylglutathione lyase